MSCATMNMAWVGFELVGPMLSWTYAVEESVTAIRFYAVLNVCRPNLNT